MNKLRTYYARFAPKPCISELVPEEGTKSSVECKNILEKLCDIYLKERHKEIHYKDLTFGCNLLTKLLAEEELNCLIVNLYPNNDGYSIALKSKQEPELETIRFSYEESDFLSYINNEELPPMLIDLLESSGFDLFYEGCVIAEIRDYRKNQSNPSYCNISHVLLKPTTQSILSDVNLLTQKGDWSYEEKLSLECQLVLATSSPLILEPFPSVGYQMNKLMNSKKRLYTHTLRQTMKRNSQPYLNRHRNLDQLCNSSPLLDFLNTKKDRKKITLTSKNSKIISQPWQEYETHLEMPAPVDVSSVAKPIERPIQSIDSGLVTLEEYIFETEKAGNKLHCTRLTIQQRPSDEQYVGELYVDQDYVKGQTNGSSCRFQFGSRRDIQRYIQQFTEIFTEEGRKAVCITQLKPGQAPRISFTQGSREREKLMTSDLSKQLAISNSSLSSLLTSVNESKNSGIGRASTSLLATLQNSVMTSRPISTLSNGTANCVTNQTFTRPSSRQMTLTSLLASGLQTNNNKVIQNSQQTSVLSTSGRRIAESSHFSASHCSPINELDHNHPPPVTGVSALLTNTLCLDSSSKSDVNLTNIGTINLQSLTATLGLPNVHMGSSIAVPITISLNVTPSSSMSLNSTTGSSDNIPNSGVTVSQSDMVMQTQNVAQISAAFSGTSNSPTVVLSQSLPSGLVLGKIFISKYSNKTNIGNLNTLVGSNIKTGGINRTGSQTFSIFQVNNSQLLNHIQRPSSNPIDSTSLISLTPQQQVC